MPGKRLLLTAVLGLTMTALGCCRMCERWCGPSQQGCCAPPPPGQGCPCTPTGSYYQAPQCSPGCVPATSNGVPTVPVPAGQQQWTKPNCDCYK